jgi:hypothetical protein
VTVMGRVRKESGIGGFKEEALHIERALNSIL